MAHSTWSAIEPVASFSRSAIELGSTFVMSASDLACSTRNAASASLRWWAKDASTVKATAPVPITLSANIVVVNHAGTSTSRKNSSPTMPRTTNVTTNAMNQPIA